MGAYSDGRLRFIPTLKRIVQGGGGGVNFHGDATPGIQLGARLDTTGSTRVGVAAAVTNQVGSLRASSAPAIELVRINWDLNHASHIVTAVNVIPTTKDWTNPTNAQGAPDGTLAAYDGDAILLATGVLRGNFVTHPARGDLIIDSVHLDFYGSVAGLPVLSDLVSRLDLTFTVDAVPTTLERINTGDSNFLSTPKSFRIDNGAGNFIGAAGPAVTWARLSAMFANWDAAIVLGLVGAHYRADSVRLRVVAHETQPL